MKKLIVSIVLVALAVGVLGTCGWLYCRRNTGARVLNRAMVALRAGNYRKAVDVADQYIARHPKDWRGYNTRGEALLRLATYEDARKSFQEAARLNPAEVGPILGLASTYSFPAKKSLVRSEAISPIDVMRRALKRFVQANRILLDAGNLGDAEVLDLQERIGRDYHSISLAWRAIGTRLAREARTAEGVRFNFVAAVKREESAAAMTESAKAAGMAIAALLDVVQKDASRPEAASTLVTLCLQQGDTKSLASARRAIYALKNPPAVAAMNLALYDLQSSAGESENEHRKQLVEFCRTLDRLLKADPGQLDVKLTRAEAAYMLKDYATAERICGEVLRANKRQGRARLIMAYVKMARGRFVEAERQLFGLKMDYPNWAEAHYAFALACISTGKKALAERAMRAVTQLDSRHAKARAYLAETLMRSGFFDEAFVDAEAYYRAHGDDPVAVNLYVQAALGLARPRTRAAETALKKAWAEHSKRAEMMTVVGEGYDRLGQKNKAQQAFRVAAACNGRTVAGRLAVARALRRIGREPEAEKVLMDELARQDDQPRVHYELGRLYASTGREPQAIDQLRMAEKLDPREADYRLALAVLWFNIGDLSECLRVLDRVDPDDVEAKLLRLRVKLLRRESVPAEELLGQIDRTKQAGLSLAVAYLNSGRPQWCVNVCKAALKTTPDDRALRFLLGQAYLALGQEDKCLAQWSIVVGKAPRQLPVYLSIAAMLAAKHQPDQVADILSRITGAHRDMVDLTMGWLYTRRRNFSAAAKIYGKLADDPATSDFIRNRARLLRARATAADGRIDEALKILNDLAADGARPKAAMEVKAKILARAGRSRDARSTVMRLGELVAADRDGPALRRVARLMIRMGQFTEALALCDRLQELLPHDARSYVLRAAVLDAAGRKAETIPLLNKAIELQPGSFGAYVVLANTLDELHRPRAALEALRRMNTLGPAGKARAIFERGMMLARWGLAARAVKCFERLGGQDRSDSPALELAMGRTLAKLGATDRARTMLDKVPAYSRYYVAAQLQLAALAATDVDRLAILNRLAKDKPTHTDVLERRMRAMLRLGMSDQAVKAFRAFTEEVKASPRAMATVHSLALQAMMKAGQGDRAAELARKLSSETRSPEWKQLGILLSLDGGAAAADMLPDVSQSGLYDALLGLIIAAQDKNTVRARQWAERVEQLSRESAGKGKPAAIPASYRLLAVLVGRPAGYGGAELAGLIRATGLGQEAAKELVARHAAAPLGGEPLKLLKAAVAIDLGLVAMGRKWAIEALQARPTCQWAAALVMKTRPDRATHRKVADTLRPSDCVLALRIRASLFRDEGVYRKAAEFYGRAARAAGGQPYLVLAQAVATENAGELPEALAMYEQVWRKTGDPLAGNNAAFIVSELYPSDTSRLDQALQWAQQAVRAAPDDPTFLDTRGWILLLLGKTDLARADLRRAVRGNPTSAATHYHVGLVEERIGHRELAKWHFEAAVSNAEATVAGGSKPTPSLAKVADLARRALSQLSRSRSRPAVHKPDKP